MNTIMNCVRFIGFTKLKIPNTRTLTRMSYLHHVGNTPLQYLTLGNLIEKSALQHGEKTAIISMEDDREISFMEIFKKCDKLAAGFRKIGLEVGDRVGLWAPNILEWFIVMFACARAGLVTVPLNPSFTAKDIEFCINKIGIKLMVCPESHKKQDFYKIMCQLIPNLQESDPDRMHSPTMQMLKSIISISNNTLKGTYNYHEILDSVDNTQLKSIRELQDCIQPDSLVTIQFTSGTTGTPNATGLGHFQLVNNCNILGKRLELEKYDHNLCVQVPFFHAFGIISAIMPTAMFGNLLTLPSITYNSKANLKALEEKRCSLICGTPTMFVDLINLQKIENKQIYLKTAFCGGAPCAPQLYKDMQNILKIENTYSAYGLTEATALVFQSLPTGEDDHKKYNTIGHVVDNVEVKVIDQKGNMVPMGTPGELCVRGYPVMLGYYNDEKKTKETMTSNWLKTGDQVILQEDGYARVVGRLKDMIIRGGENIFPREIEDVLNAHPDVIECYVIGLSHERLGEEVCACLRVKADTMLHLNDIIEYCQDKLASFKIPSQLRILDSFPKTQSGKIQKHILKQQIEEK